MLYCRAQQLQSYTSMPLGRCLLSRWLKKPSCTKRCLNDATAKRLPLAATLHLIAAIEVFLALMVATVSEREQKEVNPTEVTLLSPVAVTLLPDATKEVFATLMLEESWLKDANPIDATASLPEADTRLPTQVTEVAVAVKIVSAGNEAKPILATPFDPLAVTLHLNAVSEVFVVETVEISAEYEDEETMPMDAIP